MADVKMRALHVVGLAGEYVQPGEIFTVDAETAAYLEENGAAERLSSGKKKSSKKASSAGDDPLAVDGG